MKVKFCAGIAAAAAAIGALGMAGASSASPVVTASVPVAHCNVILADGHSPCFPSPIIRPIMPVSPGGPMKASAVTAAS
jgi:hypothetical protein